MIDPRADRPLYKQLADLLRTQITSGELVPGRRLPSETTLGQTYGLARPAVRAAIAILRSEGLVDTARGLGTRVRKQTTRRRVVLRSGDRLTARSPSDHERNALDLDDGVPLLEITHIDGSVKLYAANLVEITSDPGQPQDAIQRTASCVIGGESRR